MLVCPQCGMKYPEYESVENLKRCFRCGTELVDEGTTPPRKEVNSTAQTSSAKAPKHQGNAANKKSYQLRSADTAGLEGVGGWLLLFVIGCFVSAILNGAWVVLPNLPNIIRVTGLIFAVFSTYIGYRLIVSKTKTTVTFAKVYLVFNIIIGFIFVSLGDIRSLRMIIYGVIWLIYFSVSQRVKATYLEEGKITVRELALSGVLIALAIVLKLPLLSVPNVEFFTFVVFSSGYLLGIVGGVVVGIVSISIYTTLITPYGLPPLPIALAQILSMALIGFAGGLINRLRLIGSLKSFFPYLIMGLGGLVLTIIYDLLTNLAVAYVMGQFYPVMVAAIPFVAIHLLSNFIIFLVFTPLLMKMSQVRPV